MYFFERNEQFKNNIACICDDGCEYTYQQLWDMGDELLEEDEANAKAGRHLVLLQVSNDIESLAAYLANLRAGNPVILMSKDADQSLVDGMKENYGLTGESANSEAPGADKLNPDLALLLSTSGSTGAQKLVRLSYENLQSNCDSIVEYLGLTSEERPITTLPMEYTYGLSVLHSHLAVGATIILTNKTLFNGEFWEMAEKYGATSMAGVPYTYAMYDRLKLTQMDLPDLKTMTQAGGHLKPELQEKFAGWAAETDRKFFVMYGQTEATARMSYVPPERCLDKPGSIGIPVPGGRMEIVDDEIIYYGPNVSMGYATCTEDLAKEDENRGRLATGDMGYMDEEGYFYITGRKKRFIKLQGKRISLDQIQDVLTEELPDAKAGALDLAVTGEDDREIAVWIAGRKADNTAGRKADSTGELAEAIQKIFEEKWAIRGRMVSVKEIDRIPRNTSGKIIYKELRNK
ncbi:MAG: AMP-binding protein [Bacillota bacterium]|nr:AMP-binding protein [Bacillota bacterium]